MMKERIKNVVEKARGFAHNTLTKSKYAVGSAVAASSAVLLGVAAGAEGEVVVPSIASNVTGSMLNGILTQITDLVPVLLPTIVACLAFRKGLSFLMSTIRGI